jgi:hypothetical protein
MAGAVYPRGSADEQFWKGPQPRAAERNPGIDGGWIAQDSYSRKFPKRIRYQRYICARGARTIAARFSFDEGPHAWHGESTKSF